MLRTFVTFSLRVYSNVPVSCVHISVQNIPPPATVDKPVLPDIDSVLQEQERIITMSYALASEASLKSKQVAGKLTSSITTNLN